MAKAQQLIYEAVEAKGKQRYQLAQEAIAMNPNCVDVYVILAEQEVTLEEMAKLYKEGRHAGEIELGKDFFEENKGYFWGMIETRPFMRTKLNYAEALYQLGNSKDAMQHYEELLDLNPNDNQGVRYLLFVAYMDNVKKVRRLLQQYKEGTVYGLYNKLLLEIHESRFTENAVKLFKNAKKQNKHVADYLTGKKRLPQNVPDYYGFGDENEAIVYADTHLHLWEKIDGLQAWLKKQR